MPSCPPSAERNVSPPAERMTREGLAAEIDFRRQDIASLHNCSRAGF
jgi:hypothetical protein